MSKNKQVQVKDRRIIWPGSISEERDLKLADEISARAGRNRPKTSKEAHTIVIASTGSEPTMSWPDGYGF